MIVPNIVGDPIRDTDSGLLFHFPHHCGIGNFKGFTSISQRMFMILGEMTDADKRMNPLHFESGLDSYLHQSGNSASNPRSLLIEILPLVDVCEF